MMKQTMHPIKYTISTKPKNKNITNHDRQCWYISRDLLMFQKIWSRDKVTCQRLYYKMIDHIINNTSTNQRPRWERQISVKLRRGEQVKMITAGQDQIGQPPTNQIATPRA